jgi:hypothetical protein
MDHAANDDATTGADEYQARLARAEDEIRDLQRRVERLENHHRLASLPERQSSGDHHHISSTAAQGQDAKYRPGSVPAERKQHEIVIAIGLEAVQSDDDGRRLVAHAFVHAPEELRDHFRVEGNLLDELLGSTRDRVIEVGADKTVSPGWDRATLTWHPIDFGQFDYMAGLATNLQDEIHAHAGHWAAQIASRAGVPFGDGAIVANVIPLPTDRPLTLISQVVDLAGVAFGLLTGHALVAIASFKSLVHKQLVHSVASAIEQSLFEQADNDKPLRGGSPDREPIVVQVPVSHRVPESARGRAAPAGGSTDREPKVHPAPVSHGVPESARGRAAPAGGSTDRELKVKRTRTDRGIPRSEQMPPQSPGTGR